MTTNEREFAQLERDDSRDHTETAIALVEVAARNEFGVITQIRRFREATAADLLRLGYQSKGQV